MLTAIRAMAEEAERRAGAGLQDALDAVLQAGDEAVARTTAMLPVLRQAGVVDAGAAGLVEYVRGAVAGLEDRTPAPAPVMAASAPIAYEAIHLEPGALHAGGVRNDRHQHPVLRVGRNTQDQARPDLRRHTQIDDPD